MLLMSALPPLSVRIPASTFVGPLKVFTPLKVNSSAPAFVKLYAPLTTPLNVAALATVSVVAAPSTTFPLKVSAPLLVASPNPSVPLIENSFAKLRAVAESLEIRPPLKVTVPLPSAALSPTWITPSLKVTPPLKLFEPLIVNTALPVFTRLPAPLINPLYVVSTPPLTLNTFPCKSTAPAPARLAISSLLASFNVPPADTVTAMLLMSALPPLNVRIPASTFVEPLKVFTPLKVNSSTPAFVRLYTPLTTPLNVAALATVSVVSAPSGTFPLKVSAPLLVASPKPSVPLIANSFASVRAVAELLEIRPALNVTVPVPSAALSPTWIAPSLRVTPPLNVFAPLIVNTALPVFTKLPAPLINPL
jgi:hypothetical protein